MTENLFSSEPQRFVDSSLRAGHILLKIERSDPVQPRRVLPGSLHFMFNGDRLTLTRVLRELVQTMQATRRDGHRGYGYP